ncbi:MAG: hypothetical protein AAFU65_08115 [Pseudomonadota bacterium]
MRLRFIAFYLCLATAALPALGSDTNASENKGGWTPFNLNDGVVAFAAHVWRRELGVTLGSASPSSSVSDAFVQAALADAGESGAAVSQDAPPLPQLPVLIASRRVKLPEVYRVPEEMGDGLHAGRAFFSGVIVQLDYPNRRLRVLDQDALNLKILSNVRARRVNQRIGTHVELSVDGKPFWAALATEYSGALMAPRGLAGRLGWLDEGASAQGAVEDHRGREVVTDGVTLPAVQIGPYQVNNVDVVLMEDGDSPLPGDYEQETAIIGNELLQHFQLSIDLDRAFLHIQSL